jgi:Holliday junction resolvasome RuvABC endonuclease subunit
MTTLLDHQTTTPPPPTGQPRVLGLDLSLTATGICLPNGSTLTIKTKTADGDRRLVHIAETIRAIATEGADLAVIEDLPTHAKAAGITGMVHGAARVELIRAGVPFALIVPATLKAYATGTGAGDKTAMALAAFKRAGFEFADDNQCDAWWLRCAGLDRLGWPPIELPKAQRDRLGKAKWPERGNR